MIVASRDLNTKRSTGGRSPLSTLPSPTLRVIQTEVASPKGRYNKVRKFSLFFSPCGTHSLHHALVVRPLPT